ncbi:MAG: hypothetical protein EOO88_41610 [Pedobacter sp.]|nr:MAG: hypothetical protein EOO88_41610 [Pedobacter sp.]
MKFSTYTIACFILLSSCGTQKKMKTAERSIQTFEQQTQAELAGLLQIKNTVQAKSSQKNIDSSSTHQLQAKFSKLEDSISNKQSKANAVRKFMNIRKDFRRSYKNNVLPLIVEIDTFNNQSGKRDRIYAMLRDAVNTANYNLFDFAAFFDPGVYRIPPQGIENVNKMFGPVIDSIITFSNKYTDIPHTASIVLLGYADGLGISDSTELFATLSEMLKDTMPGRPALNRQLSQLRAQALQSQLKNLVVQKAPLFSNFNNIRLGYIAQGRGEEYPLPGIKDYQEDDDRRRIVLCYWTIIPEF